MSRNKLICILFILLAAASYSQKQEIKGNVSFISSRNIYVKFSSTEGIAAGDTLFYKLAPVLTAKYISAGSVAGEGINSISINKGDEISAFINIPEKEENKNEIKQEKIIDEPVEIYTGKSVEFNNEIIDGRISVQSFSNFSNWGGPDFQRWRYTVTFNGTDMRESGLSASAFFNFNYRADEWNRIKSNPAGSFRVYDLAFKYQLGSTSSITAGRHLNEKLANIGPIDGLQFMQSAGNFNIGAFVGSRPDFSDLGFNVKLFQAGAYVSRTDTFSNQLMENTAAFVQQTNNFKTDRRLLYFQHSNDLIRSLSFFASVEADLYKKINEKAANEFSLTGLFLSVRYNLFTFASLSVSYDARRNVIYYETFKNYIESLLENEMRQGFRGTLNLRILPDLFAGLNYGYRFRKGDLKPSADYGGYLSYTSIPFIGISPSVSFSGITGSYISGNIFSGMISKNIDLINSYITLTYRNSNYKFPRSISSVQHMLSADINTRLIRQIFLSAGWEGIFEGRRTSGRIVLDITSRL